MDAFTGAGGNAIALARACEHVVAIDCSLERVALAKSNTAVYGAANKVDFLCADFFRCSGRSSSRGGHRPLFADRCAQQGWPVRTTL